MKILSLKKSISCSPLRLVFSLAPLALSCFALPVQTRADCGATGDIPFTATMGLGESGVSFHRVCLYVKGPWGRISNGVRLEFLKQFQPCTFYAADANGFSPYGEWSVILTNDTSYRDFCSPYALSTRDYHRQSFSVNDRQGASIDITASGGRIKTTVNSGSKNITKTESFLGESGNNVSDGPAAGDGDVFYFVANAGDTVRVRLEADGVRGNNGGKATLRFIGPVAGEVTGTLPLELPPVQLGSTTRCDIAIEQAAGQGDEQYRGGYILTVESSLGNIERLVPTDSVEF